MEGGGVILYGYGWCYGVAFTAAHITRLHRHCFAALGDKNFSGRALYAWYRGGFKKPISQEMAGEDGVDHQQGKLVLVADLQISYIALQHAE